MRIQSVSEIREASWKSTKLPLLWHYTKEVLLELGYSEEKIEQLSAMKVTKARTKTEVIKFALENIIRKNKLQKLKSYRGELEIEINLDVLRKRH